MYRMKKSLISHGCALLALAAVSQLANAANWSDTYIGYRKGSTFAEPFNPNDIGKDILNLSHISGYKYGTNFFNVDMLMSDSKDPAAAGSSEGAQEVYVVYRNTVDLEKVTGTPYKFGPVRGTGVTFGFDYNTKTDAGYNSKKRMLVVGPTLEMDVPGFLNVGLYELWESNAPNATPRYTYSTHPMVGLSWGVPIASLPLSFEGFANFIASKGKDEFGNDTAAETNIDMQIMYDLGAALGSAPKTFKVGLEYQYWENKFGNDSGRMSGATAKTPMIRMEYHF
jgi:nucleoside-specific outer membrane channel protein Tsx